jgi:hypothetical protein
MANRGGSSTLPRSNHQQNTSRKATSEGSVLLKHILGGGTHKEEEINNARLGHPVCLGFRNLLRFLSRGILKNRKELSKNVAKALHIQLRASP